MRKLSKNKSLFKLISVILIQAFLCLDFVYAANGDPEALIKGITNNTSNLSPKVEIQNPNFLDVLKTLVEIKTNLSNSSEKTNINIRKLNRRTILEKYQSDHAIDKIVIDLADPEAKNSVLVGGKGKSLAELSAIVAVPEAYVVSSKAFEEFIKSSPELLAMIQELDELSKQKAKNQKHQKKILKMAANIRKKMEKIEVPDFIQKSIKENYQNLNKTLGEENLPVAVRSSGTLEDQEGISAAGQHDSYLNQVGEDQVVKSVKKVWISLFNDRAVGYRAQKNLPQKDVNIAVVVQRSVEPAVSGIGFSVDPVNGKDSILLSVGYGFGEMIVSGELTAEKWWINPDTYEVMAWKIGNKDIKFILSDSGSGLKKVETREKERDNFALEDYQASFIAHEIGRIKEEYNKGIAEEEKMDIDTEFLIDKKGRLYFVQARPVTGTVGQKMMVKDSEQYTAKLEIKGTVANIGAASGKIHFVDNPTEVEEGDIVITHSTNPDWAVSMGRARVIITEVGDILCHAAIVSRELNMPTIVGIGNEMMESLQSELNDGQEVTVDTFEQKLFESKLELAVREDFGKTYQAPTSVQTLEETITKNKKEIRDRGRMEMIDNLEWHARPPAKLPAFQRDLMAGGYVKAAEELDISTSSFRVRNDNQRQKVYVQMDDNFEPRRVLAKMSLDDLKEKMGARDRNIEELLNLVSNFKGTIQDWQTFKRLYIKFIADMSISREYRTILQMRLDEVFRKYKIPATAQERIMRSVQKEAAAYTSGEGIKEYTEILRQARRIKDKKGKNLFLNHTPEDIVGCLSHERAHPDLYDRILRYLKNYKSPGMVANISIKPNLEKLIKRMIQDIKEKAPQYSVEERTFDDEIKDLVTEFSLQLSDGDKEELKTVSVMATSAALQMENEHHYKTRVHFRMREALLKAAKTLMDDQQLQKESDIFELTIDNMIGSLSQVVFTQEAREELPAYDLEDISTGSFAAFRQKLNIEAMYNRNRGSLVMDPSKFQEMTWPDALGNDMDSGIIHIKDRVRAHPDRKIFFDLSYKGTKYSFGMRLSPFTSRHFVAGAQTGTHKLEGDNLEFLLTMSRVLGNTYEGLYNAVVHANKDFRVQFVDKSSKIWSVKDKSKWPAKVEEVRSRDMKEVVQKIQRISERYVSNRLGLESTVDLLITFEEDEDKPGEGEYHVLAFPRLQKLRRPYEGSVSDKNIFNAIGGLELGGTVVNHRSEEALKQYLESQGKLLKEVLEQLSWSGAFTQREFERYIDATIPYLLDKKEPSSENEESLMSPEEALRFILSYLFHKSHEDKYKEELNSLHALKMEEFDALALRSIDALKSHTSVDSKLPREINMAYMRLSKFYPERESGRETKEGWKQTVDDLKVIKEANSRVEPISIPHKQSVILAEQAI